MISLLETNSNIWFRYECSNLDRKCNTSWLGDNNNRIVGNGTQYIIMAHGSSGVLIDYHYAIDGDDIVDGVNLVRRRPIVKIMLPNTMNVTQMLDPQHIHLMLMDLHVVLFTPMTNSRIQMMMQYRLWVVKNGIRGDFLVHILMSVAVEELIRSEELPPVVGREKTSRLNSMKLPNYHIMMSDDLFMSEERSSHVGWEIYTSNISAEASLVGEVVDVTDGNPDRLVDGVNTIGILLTSSKADTEDGYLSILTEDEGRDPNYFSLACIKTRQRYGWQLDCSTTSDPYIFVYVVDGGKEESVKEFISIVLLKAVSSLKTAPLS
eukprot:Gb_34709 [translate_table: standard]